MVCLYYTRYFVANVAPQNWIPSTYFIYNILCTIIIYLILKLKCFEILKYYSNSLKLSLVYIYVVLNKTSEISVTFKCLSQNMNVNTMNVILFFTNFQAGKNRNYKFFFNCSLLLLYPPISYLYFEWGYNPLNCLYIWFWLIEVLHN